MDLVYQKGRAGAIKGRFSYVFVPFRQKREQRADFPSVSPLNGMVVLTMENIKLHIPALTPLYIYTQHIQRGEFRNKSTFVLHR